MSPPSPLHRLEDLVCVKLDPEWWKHFPASNAGWTAPDLLDVVKLVILAWQAKRPSRISCKMSVAQLAVGFAEVSWEAHSSDYFCLTTYILGRLVGVPTLNGLG